MTTCSAPECTLTAAESLEVQFFPFPKDEERCRQWVINTKNRQLYYYCNKSETIQSLSSTAYLCAKHFHPSQIASDGKTLVKGAIPTIFHFSSGLQRSVPYVLQRVESFLMLNKQEKKKAYERKKIPPEKLLNKRCRICGKLDPSLISIFSSSATGTDNDISEIINAHLPIQVSETDIGFPKKICQVCVTQLTAWKKLVEVCMNANRMFADEHEQSTEPIESDQPVTKKPEDPTIDHDYCQTNTSEKEAVINSIAEDMETGDIKSDEPQLLQTIESSVESDTQLTEIDYKADSNSPQHCDSEMLGIFGDSSIAYTSPLFDEDEHKSLTVDESLIVDENVSPNSNEDTVSEEKKATVVKEQDKHKNAKDETNSGLKIAETFSLIKPKKNKEFLIAKDHFKLRLCLMPSKNIEQDLGSKDPFNVTISKEPCRRKRRHGLDSTIERKKLRYERIYNYICPHCPKDRMTASEYGSHLTDYHPDVPLACPICQFVFKADYNLVIHLQVTSCGIPKKSLTEDAVTVVDISGKTDASQDAQNTDDKPTDESLEIVPSEEISVSEDIKNEIGDHERFENSVKELGSDACILIVNNTNTNDTEVETSPLQMIEDVPAFDSDANSGTVALVENDAAVHDSNSELEKVISPPIGNECSPLKSVVDVTLSNNNPEAAKRVETVDQYVICVETWKPATKMATFEAGVIILNDLSMYPPKTKNNIICAVRKAMKMRVLTTFDATALKLSLDKAAEEIKNANAINTNCFTTDNAKNQRTIAQPNLNIITTRRPKKVKPKKEKTDTFILCNDCGFEARSRIQYSRHRKKEHTERKCSTCDLVFCSLKKLRKHEREHKKDLDLICDLCGTKFVKMYKLKVHKLLAHNIGEYVYCETCGKQFASKNSLHFHKINVHSKEQHLCSYCGQIYKTRNALRIHLKTKHMNMKKNFECSICKKAFINNAKMKYHYARHFKSNSIPCKDCNKLFSSEASLKQHQELHTTEPVAVCAICGRGFKRISRLTLHLRKVHWTDLNISAELLFPCLVCNIVLENDDTLSQHMGFHVGDDRVKNVEGEKFGKILCKLCHRFLNNRRDYAIHRIFSHEELPFSCGVENCNHQFWSKAAYDVHRKTHPTFHYQCIRCQIVFSSFKEKQTHVKTVHSSDKDCKYIKCKECGKMFKSTYTLEKHSVVHSIDKKYECNLCSRKFKLPQILARHLRWHEKKRLRNEPQHVTIEFMNNDVVKEEVLEILYSCSECDSMFPTRAGLEVHFEEKHNDKDFDFEPLNIAIAELG